MSESLSVIIPIYNVEAYLSECLVSIVNQSYKDLEILLVDDGSTDNSGKICDEWAEKDKRIRVFHKDHEGVSVARNTGMLECKGQLIAFVDSDDWLEPDMYELMVERFIHSEADVVMCGYYSYLLGRAEPIVKGILPTKDGTFEDAVFSIIKRNGYYNSIWNKMFRRETIVQDQKIVLMDPNISFGEDELWLFEVLHGCKCISFIPQALYHWRSREGSLSRGEGLTRGKMSVVEARKRSMGFLPSSESVQCFMKGKTYNEFHGLLIEAYMTKDRDNYQILSSFLKPFRWDFINSSEITMSRKMGVCLWGLFMRIRMPIAIINVLRSIKQTLVKHLTFIGYRV